MKKTCKQCGAVFEVFRGPSLRREYCSIECRDKASGRIRYKQGTVGVCKACGKEFIKQYGNETFCGDECKRNGRLKWRRERYMETYIPKPPKFTTCAYCGAETDGKKYCSPGCESKAAYKRQKTREFGTWANYQTILKEAREALQIEREKQREAKKKQPIKKTCVVCGAPFETLNPQQRTCSKQCGRKLSYARKQKRIPKEQIIDHDITLEALYKRDSGVCYLCGGICDWKDRDELTGVCGNAYPSIDHLVPVSRGGLHAWTNVRLAHFGCNVAKSDSLLPNVAELIPENALEFKRETKRPLPKQTEQYTTDGRLVAVYESTGSAAKKTNVPAKRIQDCARGRTKTAGGYVWKYGP